MHRAPDPGLGSQFRDSLVRRRWANLLLELPYRASEAVFWTLFQPVPPSDFAAFYKVDRTDLKAAGRFPGARELVLADYGCLGRPSTIKEEGTLPKKYTGQATATDIAYFLSILRMGDIPVTPRR